MEIRPVGAKLFLAGGREDGLMGGHDEATSRLRIATKKIYTITDNLSANSDSHSVTMNTAFWFVKPYTLIHR